MELLLSPTRRAGLLWNPLVLLAPGRLSSSFVCQRHPAGQRVWAQWGGSPAVSLPGRGIPVPWHVTYHGVNLRFGGAWLCRSAPALLEEGRSGGTGCRLAGEAGDVASRVFI